MEELRALKQRHSAALAELVLVVRLKGFVCDSSGFI
jgi:hypothetical protein